MLRAFTLALVLSLTAAPLTAEAYCINIACPDGGDQSCDGDPLPDGCSFIRWPTGCVGFSVQRDGYSKLDATELDGFVHQAFSTWANQDCGGGAGPGFIAQDLGEVTCDVVEYNTDAGNANVIMVREKAWTHPPTAGHNIALTTTTYDPDTGALLNADMELNAADFNLTTSDTEVEYDLLSVLTHETGHFFGLAHSADPGATMRPSYDPGSIDLRAPIDDDRMAMCSLYPPNPALDNSCDPLPKHGFSPECKGQQAEGTCAVSLAPSKDTSLAAILIGGLALTAIVRSKAPKARSERRRRS